jgi:hypothetical protein
MSAPHGGPQFPRRRITISDRPSAADARDGRHHSSGDGRDRRLAFSLEEYVAPHLASGALVRVLEDWCPPFSGFFLYYPSRRQQPAALSALIETLRL